MKKHEIIKDSWVWNGSVEEFVKSRMEGHTLNVCAGKSPLGDVKIDIDTADRSVIRGDMIALPLESNMFDTVIQDPPWKI